MTRAADIRDSIPRLQQLVPHMRDQLVGLRDGATFEEARQRYSATVDRLVSQGRGRRTTGRVLDKDRYWSPTRDLLDEAMHLEFVDREKLPSARKYLDAYRDRHYKLTGLGERTARYAQEDTAKFVDKLVESIYRSHPNFQKFMYVLKDEPLVCPETTEGEVDRARNSGNGVDYWVSYVEKRLSRNVTDESSRTIIRDVIVSTVRKRFGFPREETPDNKSLAKTLNESFAVAAARVRGLSVGATDLNMLKSWGAQLILLDQSRYVPGFDGRNVIWLAADLDREGEFAIRRRTLNKYESEVSGAIVSAYRDQAAAAKSHLRAPYLPIYRVRADAAFRCKVMRALVDLTIERMVTGETPNSRVRIWLHLGATRQPDSEPIYRRGGHRRYEMTMQPKDAAGESP